MRASGSAAHGIDGRDPAPLDGVLYLSTMVILRITLQRTTWFVHETSPVSRLVIWPLLQYGVDDTFRVLDAWRHVPPIGWIGFGVEWIGTISPGLTSLTMISIYRRPAKAAKQVRGDYVRTEHAR